MKDNMRRLPIPVKIVLLVVLAFIGALTAEFFCFGISGRAHQGEGVSFQLGENSGNIERTWEKTLIPLSEDERNSIRMNRDSARILAEVNGEKYEPEQDETLMEEGDTMYRRMIRTSFSIEMTDKVYMGKLFLQCGGLEENGDYILTVYDGGEAVFKGIHEVLDARLDGFWITVNQEGDRIDFSLYTQEEPKPEEMSLSIRNEYSVNWLRVFFLFVLFVTLAVFLLCGSAFRRRVENLFVLFSLLLGCTLILCIGTNQVGFDEYIHGARAYDISFGSTIQTTEAAMRMKANDLPFFHNREERSLVETYEEVNHDYSWADITSQSRFVSYADRSYLPISIFIKIGRALGLPFAWNMMLGKFGGLLFKTLLGYLAIRFARSGKGIIAMLALIPNEIFAASSLSYDGVVNGFLLLAVVLTMNCLLEEERNITGVQVLLVLGAYIAGSTAKAIYILMAFMLLFLGQSQFGSRLRKWVFRVSVISIAGLLLYSVFFPPVSASAGYELMGNLAYAGDKRNAGTSVLGQIGYILGAPLHYMALLLKSMLGDLWLYVSGRHAFFNYGYLGGLPGGFTLAGVILLCGASLVKPREEERPVILRKYKIVNGIMILGMSAVIWSSMYISYTPVGSGVIEGVQARYFLPLLLPFALCLFNGRFTCKLKEENYNRILLGFVVFLNLLAIYTLALKPLNF